MFENIAIALAVILFPVAWYAVQYGILTMAKLGVLWDIVPEGFARAYLRMGKLAKIVMSLSGFEFDPKAVPIDADKDTDNLGIYKIVHAENKKARATATSRVLDILVPARGVIWKGPPGFYEVYTIKKLTWTDDSFEKREEENVTDILIRSYCYGLEMLQVELEGSLEFNLKFLVILQVTNPALALFRINRYVDAVMKGINLLVIKNFKGLSWTDIVGKTLKGAKPEDTNIQKPLGPLEQALKNIVDEAASFEDDWGVKVRQVGVYDFEAANDAARVAITSEEVALLKAKATLAEAEGKAKVIEALATAEANATRTKAAAEADAITAINAAADSMGPNALRLKELHAVENAGANVTLIGSGLAIPAVLPIATTKGGQI